MKLLVTGSSGFIGKNLVNALKEDHDVTPFEWGQSFPDVSSFDWVLHLGAISSTVEQDVAKIYRQNLEFSIKLYEECIAHGVNFQFASSASVYGLVSDFKETSNLDPQNHYARSKYMFEKYVEVRKAPIVSQVFRYFNVYGPHEDHKGKQASPYTQFARQARETGEIKLFENSDNYLRDFIHVDQIVSYHKQFLNIKESGVWNLGTGKTKSFYDVAFSVSGETGARIVYIPMPDVLKGNYQEFTKADTNKLRKTLELK